MEIALENSFDSYAFRDQKIVLDAHSCRRHPLRAVIWNYIQILCFSMQSAVFIYKVRERTVFLMRFRNDRFLSIQRPVNFQSKIIPNNTRGMLVGKEIIRFDAYAGIIGQRKASVREATGGAKHIALLRRKSNCVPLPERVTQLLFLRRT